MKSIALAATLAASLAMPALAQDAGSFAIMHFNMDEDTPSDRRMVPTGLTQVQLQPNSTLAEVFDHLNMDVNRTMDLSGQSPAGVTIIMSDPAHAAEIFARLMRESAEDE